MTPTKVEGPTLKDNPSERPRRASPFKLRPSRDPRDPRDPQPQQPPVKGVKESETPTEPRTVGVGGGDYKDLFLGGSGGAGVMMP